MGDVWPLGPGSPEKCDQYLDLSRDIRRLGHNWHDRTDLNPDFNAARFLRFMKLSTLLRSALLLPVAVGVVATAGPRAIAQSVYSPVSLPGSREITDTLSASDIPTGFGGFARDYTIFLEEGDQVAIDVLSDEFDTIVSLINANGNTIGENDDGPDGTTNSLLFARITESGDYTVRVRAYAGQGSGEFFLKVARLRPVD
jgi:hypothetical protein